MSCQISKAEKRIFVVKIVLICFALTVRFPAYSIYSQLRRQAFSISALPKNIFLVRRIFDHNPILIQLLSTKDIFNNNSYTIVSLNW